MVRDYSQKTVQELYETIRVNVDEEEQWKVFDFVEDFFMEELEIGDYINDINSYHLHMFDKHDVTTKNSNEQLHPPHLHQKSAHHPNHF